MSVLDASVSIQADPAKLFRCLTDSEMVRRGCAATA
jgi:uncharacterized protein YndB with AHSA1/START domain